MVFRSRGAVLVSDGEQVHTVKLTDKCPHEAEHYEVMGCGHAKCAMCNGWVHPGTKTCLPTPHPVIACNRKPKASYDYIFCEGCSGSEVLTKTMRRVFGVDKVEEGMDYLKGPH